MPIQLLPISLANQIAAGEVVERPASVVKELVENSIDAGATHIEIDIEQGGAKRIRLRDNGFGIPAEELELALSRHATSKISSLDDLEAIQSLGFRGEALASISSVSRLRLTSKPPTQSTAWQAWVEGRDMQVQSNPAAHPDGTTVDVQDLFFNTPARRKFLRTAKTEFSHIDEVVRRIALARFDIQLTLRHNQKEIRHYRVAGSQAAQQHRLLQICGQSFAREALRMHAEHDQMKLTGWVAPAEVCRHQGDIQYVYVNGRMMRDRLISHAIRQAYGDTLADDRSPSFVLYLTLPAGDVDVNVHPAKHEVRFHYARQMHDFIVQALKPAMQTARPDLADGAEHERGNESRKTEHQYQQPAASSESVMEFRPRAAQPLPGAATRPTPAQTAALTKSLRGPVLSESTGDTQANWSLLSVWQGQFALVQRSDELAFLHLRAVQQACLARQIEQQAEQGLSGQPLLVSVQVHDAELVSIVQQLEGPALARLGVEAKVRGKSLTVTHVPSMLRHTNINETVPALVERLAAQGASGELYEWLAGFAVQSEYSAVQAEHWQQQWFRELREASTFLTQVSITEIPVQSRHD